MKLILGILGIIAGIIVGAYVGLWVCFIGGIAGLLHVVGGLIAGKMLVGTLVASVLKIMFAGLAGWIAGAVLILPSWAMIVSGK